MNFVMIAACFSLIFAPSSLAQTTPCSANYDFDCRAHKVETYLPALYTPDFFGSPDSHDKKLKAEIDGLLASADKINKQYLKQKKDLADHQANRLFPDAAAIAADQAKLNDLQKRKYETYNAAVQKTIELYHLRPRITEQPPENIRNIDGAPEKPWDPKYSENETTDASGHGRLHTEEENRKIAKEYGMSFPPGADVPPATIGGTSNTDGHVVLFPGAFESPERLASTIYHETIHWLDFNLRGGPATPTEYFLSETLAYSKEIGAANVFNTSAGRIRSLQNDLHWSQSWADNNKSATWEEFKATHPEYYFDLTPAIDPPQDAHYMGNPESVKMQGTADFQSGLNDAGAIGEEAAAQRESEDRKRATITAIEQALTPESQALALNDASAAATPSAAPLPNVSFCMPQLRDLAGRACRGVVLTQADNETSILCNRAISTDHNYSIRTAQQDLPECERVFLYAWFGEQDLHPLGDASALNATAARIRAQYAPPQTSNAPEPRPFRQNPAPAPCSRTVTSNSAGISVPHPCR